MSPLTSNPVKIIQKEKALQDLPHVLKGRKALLITSPGMVKRQVVDQAKKIIGSNLTAVLSSIDNYPTIEMIGDLAENISTQSFDVYIGIGGGSVLDSVKALALCEGAQNKRNYLLNHLKGIQQESLNTKPIIAIPTTAGTGSEVTCWGTVWDMKNKKKYSVSDEKLYPEFALLDSELTYSLPYELTLTTGLDALSHAMEAIWNRNASSNSDSLAQEAITILTSQFKNNFKKTYTDPKVRLNMQKGSLLAGQASSYTRTALAHSISYPLTANLNVPHGLACSFTLPEILKYNHQGNTERTKLILQALDVGQISEASALLYKIFQETGASEMLQKYIKRKGIESELKTFSYITPARSGNNLIAANQENAVDLVLSSLPR